MVKKKIFSNSLNSILHPVDVNGYFLCVLLFYKGEQIKCLPIISLEDETILKLDLLFK